MKTANVSLPQLFLIGGTRIALGAGIGLMLANKLNKSARKNTAWTLLGVGALSTIPLAISVLSKAR